MPALMHANELEPRLRAELEQLLASLNAQQAVGHKENGSHRIANTIPIGTVIEFAGTTVPDGWLVLDGSEKSLTQYAALVRVINPTSGTSTFTLPNKASAFTLNKLIFAGV